MRLTSYRLWMHMVAIHSAVQTRAYRITFAFLRRFTHCTVSTPLAPRTFNATTAAQNACHLHHRAALAAWCYAALYAAPHSTFISYHNPLFLLSSCCACTFCAAILRCCRSALFLLPLAPHYFLRFGFACLCAYWFLRA